MQPEVRQTKEKEFREKVQILQMTFAKLQKELAAEEAKLTRGIIQKMGLILADIGKRDGYSVILEKNESRILWAPQKLDLTNELIRLYNAGSKGAKSSEGRSEKEIGLRAPIPLETIASWIGVTLSEPSATSVSGVAELHTATEKDLSLYAHSRWRKAARTTRAAVVICTAEMASDIPSTSVALLTTDPMNAWGKILRGLFPLP